MKTLQQQADDYLRNHPELAEAEKALDIYREARSAQGASSHTAHVLTAVELPADEYQSVRNIYRADVQ